MRTTFVIRVLNATGVSDGTREGVVSTIVVLNRRYVVLSAIH